MSLARSLTNYQPYDVLLQSPLFVVRVADVMFVICLTACICSAHTYHALAASCLGHISPPSSDSAGKLIGSHIRLV